ncbi:hypothetical protein D3C87_2142050 [compost metagenome]
MMIVVNRKLVELTDSLEHAIRSFWGVKEGITPLPQMLWLKQLERLISIVFALAKSF